MSNFKTTLAKQRFKLTSAEPILAHAYVTPLTPPPPQIQLPQQVQPIYYAPYAPPEVPAIKQDQAPATPAAVVNAPMSIKPPVPMSPHDSSPDPVREAVTQGSTSSTQEAAPLSQTTERYPISQITTSNQLITANNFASNAYESDFFQDLPDESVMLFADGIFRVPSEVNHGVVTYTPAYVQPTYA